MPKRNLRLLRRAQAMRAEPTGAEDILWRSCEPASSGFRFRRQEPIGPYIVDFVCKARRLVVELDGDSHVDAQADAIRDRHLRSMDYRVIRLPNNDIYEDLDDTVDWLWQRLHPGDAE